MYVRNVSKSVITRRIGLLILCALSLILTGYILSGSNTLSALFVRMAFAIYGVITIYGISPLILESNSYKEFLEKVRWMVAIGLTLVLGALFFLLFRFDPDPVPVLKIILTIGLIGLVYSLRFPIAGKRTRLKNIIVVKNLLIGVSWGLNVLLGAGDIGDQTVFTLFLFVSFQITMGSSIRDMQDIEKDKLMGIQTVPMVLGKTRSILLYFVLNVISLLALVLSPLNPIVIWVVLMVFGWRILHLIMLRRTRNREFWCQTYNILMGTYVLCIILIFQYILWS